MSDPRRTLAELNDSRDRPPEVPGVHRRARRHRALRAVRGDLAYAAPQLSGYPFRLGVASGDPTPNGVSLWTRLAPEPLVEGGGDAGQGHRGALAGGVRLELQARGEVAARSPPCPSSATRSTSTCAACGPAASTSTASSPTGTRARSAGRRPRPRRTARVRDLTFAFASCQKWDDGFYAPYRAHGRGGHRPRDPPRRLHLRVRGRLGRRAQRQRSRHRSARSASRSSATASSTALYKTDPDLQEAHRLFPWMVTWDDHEVDNDYSGIYPEFARHEPGVPRAPRRRLPGVLRAHAGAA